MESEYLADGTGTTTIDMTLANALESSGWILTTVWISGVADGEDIEILTTNSTMIDVVVTEVRRAN